jgi:hypothetical protein
LRPPWYLFAVLCFILAVVVFLLVKFSERAVIVDGVHAYVTVARVDWLDGANRSTSLLIFRDHKYYVVTDKAGFLSLYGDCSYYQGVLPQDRFEELATTVESPQFQQLPETGPNPPRPHSTSTWLVAYARAANRKCLVTPDSVVQTSTAVNPLRQWFFATQEWTATDPRKSQVRKCTSVPLDIDAWCRDRR